MDKYKDRAQEKLGNGRNHGKHFTHPEVIAQRNHVEGEFASRVLDEFFTSAYGDILVEYFIEWLKSAPHEVKTREFLYASAMGLGDVRRRIIEKETYGKNVPVIKEMGEENESSNE